MKKIKTTVCLALLATGLFAQDLVYTHDANGNRIMRETIVLKTANPGNSNPAITQEPEQQDGTKAFWLGSHILVYPNPTKGLVVLKADENLPADAEIQVFDNQSRLIRSLQVNAKQTEIDLSAQAAGIYIIRLIVQGRQKEWRVMKQ